MAITNLFLKKYFLFNALTVISLFLLSACGFSPIYGDYKNATAQNTVNRYFNEIDIAIIPNREGQYLRNALIDNLYNNGTPTNTRYDLRFSPVKENIYDFDITVESEATRRQLRLSTTMQLIDKATKQVLLSRRLTALTSNNVLESEFSTLVTEQNARENALNDLARQTERQLALYFQ